MATINFVYWKFYERFALEFYSELSSSPHNYVILQKTFSTSEIINFSRFFPPPRSLTLICELFN